MQQSKLSLCIGTKLVMSAAMSLGDYNKYQGWDIPKDQDSSAEGFLVEYLDGGKANHAAHKGYISWSPKEVFDNSYQDVTKGVSFGAAIMLAKRGHKVARKGWNGSGIYLVIMKGYPEGVPANAETAARHDINLGDIVKIRPYWALKTAQDDIAMWSPSGSDSLADDWVLVE